MAALATDRNRFSAIFSANTFRSSAPDTALRKFSAKSTLDSAGCCARAVNQWRIACVHVLVHGYTRIPAHLSSDSPMRTTGAPRSPRSAGQPVWKMPLGPRRVQVSAVGKGVRQCAPWRPSCDSAQQVPRIKRRVTVVEHHCRTSAVSARDV